MMKLEIKNLHLSGVIENLRSNQFTYGYLKIRGSKFQYLSGLSLEQFDLIMECIRPFIKFIPYADCQGPSLKIFDYETQYLMLLTISRHGLDLRFMSFILCREYLIVG